MKIIRFRGFKFLKSKYDGQTYLRMIFDGYDNTERFVAFPVDVKTKRVDGYDVISEEVRNFVRAQCMLNESKEEIKNAGFESTKSDKS